MRNGMGIGMAIMLCLIAIGYIFGAPWVVMTAWNLILNGMFGLPLMPYWTAFWATLALNIINPTWRYRSTTKD